MLHFCTLNKCEYDSKIGLEKIDHGACIETKKITYKIYRCKKCGKEWSDSSPETVNIVECEWKNE